ncbi:protein FAM210A [Aplysia californica]|uniref:Protein FAM210A n=1 Tax=Aplysia californica TaxID=6500 RepID=A0ABM0JET9_APLCA|nr:protein FAM210A [Aplysia californica]
MRKGLSASAWSLRVLRNIFSFRKDTVHTANSNRYTKTTKAVADIGTRSHNRLHDVEFCGKNEVPGTLTCLNSPRTLESTYLSQLLRFQHPTHNSCLVSSRGSFPYGTSCVEFWGQTDGAFHNSTGEFSPTRDSSVRHIHGHKILLLQLPTVENSCFISQQRGIHRQINKKHGNSQTPKNSSASKNSSPRGQTRQDSSKATPDQEKSPSSETSAAGSDTPEKLTLYQRFKKTYKEHGKVLIAVHLFTSSIWFGSFYTAARCGIDIVPYLESWNLSEKIISPFRSGGLGDLALAYLMYKLATPARYTVTIGGTNLAIRYLRKEGKLEPVRKEDTLRSLYKEGKADLKRRSDLRMTRIRRIRSGIRNRNRTKHRDRH